MKDLKWTSAIIKVLQEEQRPMHYTEIAQLVAERGYRKSLGATPQDTVSAQVSIDISRNGNSSTFIRIDKGIYALRDEFLNVVESEFINDQSKKEIVERAAAGPRNWPSYIDIM